MVDKRVSLISLTILTKAQEYGRLSAFLSSPSPAIVDKALKTGEKLVLDGGQDRLCKGASVVQDGGFAGAPGASFGAGYDPMSA